MKWADKETIAEQSGSLSIWQEEFRSLPDVALDSLDPQTTALFIVDMIIGFAVKGALSSPRIGELISPIAELAARCHALGMPVVAFADTHSPQSEELASYPSHCLRGTEESWLCPEIMHAIEQNDRGSFTLIEKNSTNGFVEPAFEQWLKDRHHHPISTYLIVGDCTDICISQFALTAKAWHNTRDIPLRVLVPLALNDTYDSPGHPADVMNLFSLAAMRQSGVELCGSIR